MAFNSAKLAELRKAKGLSQEEAASKSGVPSGTYRDLELGRGKNPTLETVRLLAVFFGVNVEEFINGGHIPQPVGRPAKTDLTGPDTKLIGTVGASALDRPDVFDEPRHVKRLAYPKGSFTLEVTGTSCQSAGIPDGSTIVVVPTTELPEGYFVVVANESGYGLKGYSDGKLWQFYPGDPGPTEITLDAATRVVGYVLEVRKPEPKFSLDTPKAKRKSK